MIVKGYSFEIITDIGSGINYQKPGLLKLVNLINTGSVGKIVVLYKDRLLRFGFELLEYFAKINDCEIEIIDNTEKTEEQELVEDLIQIVTVFSCKLQGKCVKRTKELIKGFKIQMIKSFKVKLKVNNKQQTQLFKCAGVSRFAYNWALEQEKTNYETGNKFISNYDLRKKLTQLKKTDEFSWLFDYDNNITKQAIKDACYSFLNFLKVKQNTQNFTVKKILNNHFILIVFV